MSSPRTLNCGVVGAGIAGLAVGIALRRAGHTVTIYEKSHFKNEVGAAITLTPNANVVLDRWGFDAVKARETDKLQFSRFDLQTLDVLTYLDLSTTPKEFDGHNLNAYHRVDLHDELRLMAVGQTQPGKPVNIELGHSVMSVDHASGTIAFGDGREAHHDLVIVADGIRSSLLKDVVGHEIPTRNMGFAVYRTLVPMERLMKDPTVSEILEKQPSGFIFGVSSESGIMYMSYPCRRDEVMNIAIFHQTKPHEHHKDGWNSPASVDDALDVLDGIHPFWYAMTKAADHMNCFTIKHRDPIEQMANGKAVLIGDAAHPMQPTHSQGACMSLEDAAALGVLFSDFQEDDTVEERLKLFNELRLPRNTVTAWLSNAMFYLNSPDSVMTKVREYWKGNVPAANQPWGPPTRRFFYSYDVFVEAEKALKYRGVEGGIPDGAIQHFSDPNTP